MLLDFDALVAVAGGSGSEQDVIDSSKAMNNKVLLACMGSHIRRKPESLCICQGCNHLCGESFSKPDLSRNGQGSHTPFGKS